MIFQPRIEGMMNDWPTAHGSGFGSAMGSVADQNRLPSNWATLNASSR